MIHNLKPGTYDATLTIDEDGRAALTVRVDPKGEDVKIDTTTVTVKTGELKPADESAG